MTRRVTKPEKRANRFHQKKLVEIQSHKFGFRKNGFMKKNLLKPVSFCLFCNPNETTQTPPSIISFQLEKCIMKMLIGGH
jgi:hypothetical protein